MIVTSVNLYPRYHPCLVARRLVKFPDVIATSPKVIGTLVLNFKPNFKCSPLKFCREHPAQFGVCAREPWSTSSVCKKIEFSLLKKVHLGGST